MKFNYKAQDATGKIVEGSVEEPNTGAVLEMMAAKGLKPISINPEKEVTRKTKGLFGGTITVTDKIFLAKYLALMLKVGTDLFRAINILIANFDKAIMKSLLFEIRTNLEKGQPFYQTFAAYPQYFSPVFVNLVKAGEASGNLEKVFEDLSVDLEKQHDLETRIRSALTYPAILFVLSILILFFLVTFALPRISAVFETGGFNPPAFSRVVFGVGHFLNNNIAIIIGAMIVLTLSGWFFIKKTLAGKNFAGWILNHTPIIKPVIYKIAIQRFAATLSSLMGAGIPILDALYITADAVVSPPIKNALVRIARDGVTKGMSLGDAFSREAVFPPVVTNLVAISERAGHLDEVLKTLADFYDSEISASVKTLVTFIEPALLVMIGFVIALIALSILVPIYQLVTQF